MTPHDPTPTPTDSPPASPLGAERHAGHPDPQRESTPTAGAPAVPGAAENSPGTGASAAHLPEGDADRKPAAVQADVDLFGNTPRHHPDWSHRRGEPRVFALIWTMFLTVLATTTLMRAAVGGRLDVAVYREAVRVMLVVIASAIVLAWPLMRLSQLRPAEGGAAATLKDMLIVLVPLQAVLWPQVILARWSVEVIAALDLHMAAWTLLTGAIVTTGLGPAIRRATREHGSPGVPPTPVSPRARTLAMLALVLLLTLTGVTALLLEGVLGASAKGGDSPAWWRLLCPQAGIYELTSDRAAYGEPIRIRAAHVVALGALSAIGALACLAAWAWEAALRPANPDRGVAPDARAR